MGNTTTTTTTTTTAAMPRGVKKENLPTKICVVCNRPFSWRKKWERCWDEVTTCSQRCKNERKKGKRAGGGIDDNDDSRMATMAMMKTTKAHRVVAVPALQVRQLRVVARQFARLL